MKQVVKPAPITALLIAFGFAACASAGSTYKSGVGETYLESAPWYAGAAVTPGNDIGHVPITFQGDRDLPATDPGRNGELAGLLADMNAYLDSAGVTVPLTPTAPQTGTPPDVQFGCEMPGDDECAGYEEHRKMRLAIGRPSASWVEWANAAAATAGTSRVLVITLEVGNYMPRQRDWKGSKEIQLGTRNTVDLPWLTSLDRPVSVLQLTGALMDGQGRAIRIGAEGILARRTNVALAGLGIQQVIRDEDIRRVRQEPHIWQSALAELLNQLTGGH